MSLLLRVLSLCVLVLAVPWVAASGHDAAGRTEWGAIAVPLRLVNLNPFHLLYGVPPSWGSRTLSPESWEIVASVDVASYLYERTLDTESVAMDGETHRLALAWRQGLWQNLEYQVEASAVAHTGGVFDEFIESWHGLFGLPQGRRNEVPRNRLVIRYGDGAGNQVEIRRDALALSTIGLGLGYSLPGTALGNDGLAVRAGLKVPVGNERARTAPGVVAASVWAETSGKLPVPADSRRWLYSATLSGLAAERPRGLSDVAGRFIFFGRFGVTWRAMERLTLTAQLDLHSSPYRASRLAPLSDPLVMVGLGGAWRLNRHTTLEVALTEDDSGRRAAPDIGLHTALRWSR